MPTTLYLSNDPADSDVSANVDKALRLVADGAETEKVTNTVTGPAFEIITDTPGGTDIWFVTKPLNPFTTAGTFDLTLYCWESDAAANARPWLRCWRLSRTGTIIGDKFIDWLIGTECSTTPDTTMTLVGSGMTNDVVFDQGDRIMAQIILTDAASLTMATGHTVTTAYGTSSGPGASLVTFNSLTVVEEKIGPRSQSLDYDYSR